MDIVVELGLHPGKELRVLGFRVSSGHCQLCMSGPAEAGNTPSWQSSAATESPPSFMRT